MYNTQVPLLKCVPENNNLKMLNHAEIAVVEYFNYKTNQDNKNKNQLNYYYS